LPNTGSEIARVQSPAFGEVSGESNGASCVAHTIIEVVVKAHDGCAAAKGTPMNDVDIKALLERQISPQRAKDLLVALVKVPSPQTELLEDEPLLKAFITSAIEPRLRTMGFSDIRYDPMGNLIATYGAGASGKSLMLIGNAMNQPAATMPNPYAGDVVDGATYGLPGECVMGKGASEQKANLAAMLHAMETVIASKIPINGELIFTCCVSGETGKHDAIKSVVEGAGVRADMAVLGGTGLKITLGNRGRIDVFVTVKGSPCHSSRPWDGVNAITGATEAIRLLLDKVRVDKTHPQLGRQSLTVNRIRSFPESTHTVQERCEFTLDRRLLPGEDPNDAFAEIERIAKEVEQIKDPISGKTYGIEVRLGPYMYPSLVTTESPVVRALLRASEVMLGKLAETYYSPSAFDQGYLNHVGIATANFGPGEHQYAHTDHDMASVERTADAAKVYGFMILDYLS
jgi:acetylornithine deacetylase